MSYLENYAGVMAAGQQLVPDLRAQAMQDAQFAEQQQQHQLQNAQLVQKMQRQQAFQSDLDKTLLDGSPQAIQHLMLRYPEYADSIKPVWEQMDEHQRSADLTQMGTIFARGNAGDTKGAAEVLRARIEGDRTAGHEDPTDQAVLAGLESDDPVQQKAALATVGIHLAALTGDKFAETYGKLNPTDAVSPFMREYNDRVAKFGKKSADEWAALNDSKFIPVQAGGQVFQASPSGYGTAATSQPTAGTTPAQPEGGDQSTSAGYSMPVASGRFGAPSQQFGAPRDGGARRHNGIDIAAPLGSPVNPIAPGKVVAVGNQPGMGGLFVRVKHADGTISSYGHLGQQSVKVGDSVGAGSTLGTVGETGNASGPVVHLVVRKNGRAVDPRPLLTGAKVVRTKQEYDRLPAGAEYIAPDGSHRRKG